MKNLHDTRLILYSIGLGISSGLERVITNFINKHLTLDSIEYHFLSFILLLILFVFTNIGLKILVHSKWITKKALKNSYIAGRWLEQNSEQETNDIDSYCCLDISYDDDGVVHIIGRNFNSNFKPEYNFISKAASIETHGESYISLSYVYTKSIGNQPDWGYLEFYGEPPSTYSGKFKRNDRQIQINAKLLKDEDDLKLLNENLNENARKVFEKYFPNNKNGV